MLESGGGVDSRVGQHVLLHDRIGLRVGGEQAEFAVREGVMERDTDGAQGRGLAILGQVAVVAGDHDHDHVALAAAQAADVGQTAVGAAGVLAARLVPRPQEGGTENRVVHEVAALGWQVL
jgi:hypothetical protein